MKADCPTFGAAAAPCAVSPAIGKIHRALVPVLLKGEKKTAAFYLNFKIKEDGYKVSQVSKLGPFRGLQKGRVKSTMRSKAMFAKFCIRRTIMERPVSQTDVY